MNVSWFRQRGARAAGTLVIVLCLFGLGLAPVLAAAGTVNVFAIPTASSGPV